MMHTDIWYLETFCTFKRPCIPSAGGAATFRETGTGTFTSGVGFLGTVGIILKKELILQDVELTTVYEHNQMTKHNCRDMTLLQIK